MMERDDPQVTVDDLMRRVHQEVERRQLERQLLGRCSRMVDEQFAPSWRAVDDAITEADSMSVVGMLLPPMTQMHGWRRKVAVPLAHLILRAAQLVTRDQNAFNQVIVKLVRLLSRSVHDRLTSTDTRIAGLTDSLMQVTSQARSIPDLMAVETRTASELDRLRNRIGALEEMAVHLRAEVARVDTTISEVGRRIDGAHEGIAKVGTHTSAQIADLARAMDASQQHTQHLRTQALLQERRISVLLEEVRRRPADAAPGGLSTVVDDTLQHLSDTFYVSFEDQFRGTREDIKQRVRVYLQIITEAGAGTRDRPVLDIGCGRGEWLEVLKENRLVGRGIDVNRAAVAESRERGLDVTEGSAVEHLQGLDAASLGAVTGIHVLEHVEYVTIIKILDECSRVLKPGGVAIFETPNPKNLLVGACQFYLDPTHKTPLHPDTMAFIAEARGLNRVHILPLHPMDGRSLAETESPVAKVLNEYLFGPQDFAVVGYRA